MMAAEERPAEAEQVLTANYEFNDEPLPLDAIDGVYDAIEEVAETGNAVIVECEDRVPDYRVYWNEKTSTVRIGALVLKASYEVPDEFVGGVE
jgi:hypothetical protein